MKDALMGTFRNRKLFLLERQRSSAVPSILNQEELQKNHLQSLGVPTWDRLYIHSDYIL